MHRFHDARRGFSLIELPIIVVILGVSAAIALPNLIESRKNGNESSAIGSLRKPVLYEAHKHPYPTIQEGRMAAQGGSTTIPDSSPADLPRKDVGLQPGSDWRAVPSAPKASPCFCDQCPGSKSWHIKEARGLLNGLLPSENPDLPYGEWSVEVVRKLHALSDPPSWLLKKVCHSGPKDAVKEVDRILRRLKEVHQELCEVRGKLNKLGQARDRHSKALQRNSLARRQNELATRAHALKCQLAGEATVEGDFPMSLHPHNHE